MTRRGLVDTVEADAMQVFVQMQTLIQMLIDGHGSIHGWPCCYIGLYVSRSLVVQGMEFNVFLRVESDA